MRWFRRRRMVRLHMENDLPSVEGIFVGFWAGHYVLQQARLFESAEASYSLDGPSTRIQKTKVALMQEVDQ